MKSSAGKTVVSVDEKKETMKKKTAIKNNIKKKSVKKKALKKAVSKKNLKQANIKKKPPGESAPSPEELDNLFGLSMDLMCVSSMTHFLKVSPSCKDILGYTESELKKVPFLDLIHPDDIKPTSDIIEEKLKEGIPAISFVNRYRHKDGSYRTLEWMTMPVPEKGLLYAVARDITESKRIKKALSESESRFEEIISSTEAGYFFINREGLFQDVNRAWLDMHGYSHKEEIIGKHFSTTQVDMDLAESQELVQALANEIKVQSGEFSRLRKDSSVGFHTFTVHPVIRDDDVVGIEGFIIDITERKKMEKALAQKGRHIQQLLDAFPCFAMILTSDREIVALNKVAKEMGGVIGKTCFESLASFDGPCSWCKADMVCAGEGFQHINAWGGGVYWDAYWVPFDKDLYLHFAFDITERKNAEAAIINSEKRFRQIINGSPIAIVLSRDGKFISMNDAALKIAGAISKEELTGKPFSDFIAPESRDEVAAKHIRRTDGYSSPDHYEAMGLRSDGTKFPFEIHSNTIALQDGMATIAFIQDITERKNAEDKIKQSLREKNVLLKEVHHRVKNNLGIIMALLQLQSRATSDTNASAILDDMHSRIMSMALVHEKLYEAADFSSISLKTYINVFVTNIFDSLGSGMEKVTYELDIEDIALSIDAMIPLGLILNELITNSLRHAFRGGEGTISISLSADGEEKTLVFSDDGVSIPEEVDIHNAKTLGLNIINTLSGQLKGSIEIDRSGGTKFIIRFTRS